MKRVLTVTSVAFLMFGANAPLHAQGRGRGRGQEEKTASSEDQKNRVPPEEQGRRVQEEQRRSAAYQQRLDQQLRTVQQQNAQLNQQKRAAAYRAQQEYLAQLQQQRQRIQPSRNYANDPYVSTPHIYRYRMGTTERQTNQYGADLLRQAVNDGYQQGYRAGQADRQDHWKANYQNSQIYHDADYGYTGNYVDESDYNYYFREGFRRGYDDGYNTQLRYGSNSNGSYSILSSVLNSILGLVSIH